MWPLAIQRPAKPVAFARASATATLLAYALSGASAIAAEKPDVIPDRLSPLATTSRITATIEFGLPALASAIERGVPRRLASFDERVNCVHRRVFVFRINANCDVEGYVERTGPISLYGRGDRVIGAVSIYGAATGQGANRFTARIHGDTEARATIEAEARPELRRDWSVELNFSDSFHWTEAPYLHVLGRDIALARYVEPRIRDQLAKVRGRALAEARRLDLRGKASTAWQHIFEPIKLADAPEVWLQVTPEKVAFAGVRARTKVLEGSLELSGSAEAFIGQAPPPVMPTPLPPLGREVGSPGAFDMILPVQVGYDALRQKVEEIIAAARNNGTAVREVQVYPSQGSIVVGLRVAKSSDSDPDAGSWVYFIGAPKIDPEMQTIALPDLSAPAGGQGTSDAVFLLGDDLISQLRQRAKVTYEAAYRKLLDTANQRLTRPLKNGFRMEGRITSAKPDRILLLPDGVTVALHVSGDLKIVYGL
jgi:hypothetical protein